MTALMFFGCALTAFGPPFWLFVLTIAADPVKIIVLILSSFIWLLSLLLSSLLWWAVVPLRETLAFGLVFAVIFQELFRIGVWYLFKKSDAVLRKITESEDTRIFQNKHTLAYVVGLGFGLMSGLISHVNVLADSLGPGTVGWNGESPTFFLASSFLCLAVILSHVAWGVVAFAALDDKRWTALAFVWAAHFTTSGLSLLNVNGLYAASILPAYLVLAASSALAFKMAGGNLAGLKRCVTLQHLRGGSSNGESAAVSN